MARRAAVLRQAVVDAGAAVLPDTIDALTAADAETGESWLVIDGDRWAFEALAAASGQLELRELSEIL